MGIEGNDINKGTDDKHIPPADIDYARIVGGYVKPPGVYIPLNPDGTMSKAKQAQMEDQRHHGGCYEDDTLFARRAGSKYFGVKKGGVTRGPEDRRNNKSKFGKV